MTDGNRLMLVKPTIKTPFHIDFEWWQKHDLNWRVYLHSLLCADHQARVSDLSETLLIDWVDPGTAEVRQMDGLQHLLVSHCALQEGFLNEHTTLVDGVFRLLLSNGNTPLSPVELENHLHRPADTILKTLAGPTVYKGLRPFSGS